MESGSCSLPHGRVSAQMCCWLWENVHRQGEQKDSDDIIVWTEGQPFSINTHYFSS